MRNIKSLGGTATRFRHLLAASAAIGAMTLVPAAPAVAAPLPAPNTLVSVCSGVSLPPSVVTGIIDPVLTGIYGPIENRVNGILGVLTAPPLSLVGAPAPLSVNINGLLTTAASGANIGVQAVASDGTLVGPADQCDAAADSYTLDTPAGVAIGGNQITGLGANGEQAVAGEIDSIAIGNNAETDATAVGAIAIGTDAEVGAGATGGVALGQGAVVNAANSVALGAGSIASRANSVEIGGRQLTGLAAGTQPTDAVNLGQLTAATQNAVLYDDATHTVVTFDGAGGTRLTNVADGAVNATSSDAVNGSQLFAVQSQVGGLNTQVTNNTTAITNLQGQVNTNTTAITNLSIQIANGGTGPVQYSNPATPTTPNGGTPTNDVTLVGAAPGPVGLHNVADGLIAAGSTDAVNGGQLYDAILGANPLAVTYDDSSRTSVTLNSGGASTVIRNVADGTAPTDAVNVRQLGAAAAGAVSQANSYTDLKFDLLDGQIGDARSDARAGTAGALAAAGMPQANGEGTAMIAGGIGMYRGKVGIAVGASYRAENGQSTYKLGVTYDSSKSLGANAGVGFEF